MIQLISEHPNVGHPTDGFKDAIEYPIRKTPCTMIYRIKGNELQVLRVLDQRGGFFNERRKHLVANTERTILIFEAVLRRKRRIRKNLRSVFRLNFTAHNTQVSLSAMRFAHSCMPTVGTIFAGLMSERSNSVCCPSVRTAWKLPELQREAVERSASKE